MTKQETLYHEDYGATLKHKCGKRIVTLSLLSFSLFFWAFFFFYGLSLLFWALSFYGLCLFLGLLFYFYGFLFLIWDNALENDDHHTSIYLQLKNYNSILRTRYDSI